MNIRVYYEDTDAGGVVYNANYLKFAERGRTEFLRETGFQSSSLHEEHGTIFVVRHVEIDYLKPAHLDDVLELRTSIEALRNSSFTMRQQVFKDGGLITDMHVVLVCVDVDQYSAVRIPEGVKSAFQGFVESVE
ncbi:MAG: tol-pal system-associated acyl-CoA thioesterase [Alphaproteobacteria bacterium]